MTSDSDETVLAGERVTLTRGERLKFGFNNDKRLKYAMNFLLGQDYIVPYGGGITLNFPMEMLANLILQASQ